MKESIKEKIWAVIKIIWFIFGGIILFWTGYFFIAIQIQKDFASILYAIMFGIGLIAIFSYIGISLLAILIKSLIQKYQIRKKAKFTEKNEQ